MLMKILSVDTSAVCASVAVVENGKIISQCNTNAGLTHSKTLLPMIDAALKNSCTDLNTIDTFACAVGPGSFTGIRIGIAAIKGLADGMNKKCIPVSTLEGLGYNLKGNDCIACAVMDARCQQVYTACFDIDGDKITRLTEDSAIKIEELGEQLKAYNKKIIFVGDGAEICHNALGYNIAPEVLRYQNAASIALSADETKAIDANELLPVYLRLPQAERELKAKKLNNK